MSALSYSSSPAGWHSAERLGALARAFAHALACVALLVFTGCGLLPDVIDETTNLNAEQLYKLAHDAMIEGNYTRAIKLFETLEARFPYGRHAQQAILELGYANYRAGETAAAVAACDASYARFPTIRMSITRIT
jgi:outer membrane protein assembly factor BamD